MRVGGLADESCDEFIVSSFFTEKANFNGIAKIKKITMTVLHVSMNDEGKSRQFLL